MLAETSTESGRRSLLDVSSARGRCGSAFMCMTIPRPRFWVSISRSVSRARSRRERAYPNFVGFLRECGTGEWCEFFEVADDPDEVAVRRPFYPRTFLPRGSKKRAHLVAGLGLDFPSLLRRCEERQPGRPAAYPLFWTVGGKQVGKGALAGWRLFQTEGRETSYWPFDGDFESLVECAPPTNTPTRRGALRRPRERKTEHACNAVLRSEPRSRTRWHPTPRRASVQRRTEPSTIRGEAHW